MVGALLALCAGGAAARNADVEAPVAGSAVDGPHRSSGVETRGARLETLWIFDADFSTTVGDDAWTATDRSGTLATENFWHHDTIRINVHTHVHSDTGVSTPRCQFGHYECSSTIKGISTGITVFDVDSCVLDGNLAKGNGRDGGFALAEANPIAVNDQLLNPGMSPAQLPIQR